jgi:hypothetical protein
MITKNFEGWLLIDWKTGDMKITKKQPAESRIRHTQIPVKLSFLVEVPDKPQLMAEGKITLSEARVSKIVADMV